MKKQLGVSEFIEYNEQIIFHETWGNKLYCYSKENNELKNVGMSSPSKKLTQRLQYMSSIRINNCGFFFPYSGSDICVLNLMDYSVSHIETTARNITGTAFYEDKVYFWSNHQNNIYCLDLKKGQINSIFFHSGIKINNGTGGRIGINGKYLYIPVSVRDEILEFDMESMDSRVIHICNEGMLFETICSDGRNFWMSGDLEKIVIWNPFSGCTETIDLKGINIRTGSIPWNNYFLSCIYKKGYMYFAPFKARFLIRINTSNKKIEIIFDIGDSNYSSYIGIIGECVYLSCENIKSGLVYKDFLFDKDGNITKEGLMCEIVENGYMENEIFGRSLSDFIGQIKKESK